VCEICQSERSQASRDKEDQYIHISVCRSSHDVIMQYPSGCLNTETLR